MNKTQFNTYFLIMLAVVMTACGGGGSTTTPTNQKNLTISKSGSGSGTVTSSPLGIDCGGDCNQLYVPDTEITLAASPDSESTFSGWSGDTDCEDGSVTMSTDMHCIASFDLTSPKPEVNLFFKSGSLSLIDPDAPSSPVEIESGATLGELQLVDASFDLARQEIAGKYVRTIVYANADDGKLYRINALKSDPQPPLPVQVSSETEADKMCKIGAILNPDGTQAHAKSDYADHSQSVYLYELPGSDGNCNISSDNEWKMIRLGMSDIENPIPAKKVLTALYDKNTGEIIGFLAIDGLDLVRCDLNFNNCSDVIAGAVFGLVTEVASNHFTGHIILRVGTTLYDYDVAGSTLTSVYTGMVFSVLNQANDGKHFYFSDGGLLLKFPMDGSGLPVTLVTETDGIYRIELTDNRVVYGTSTGTFPALYKLKSITKSGGTAISLAESEADSVHVLLFGASGNFVYYNELKLGGLSIGGVIKDDGTEGTALANTGWVGPSAGISGKLQSPTKIIRAENCAGLTCDLKSYDAASNDGEIFLGTSNFKPIFSGLGNSLLGFDVVDIGPLGARTDMFFVDLNQVDSLRQITTTSDINELSIPISK